MVRRRCTDLVAGCPGEWSLVECDACGAVFTEPPLNPAAIAGYYPAHYSSYHPGAPLRDNRLFRFLRWAAMAPYTLRFGSPEWLPRPFGGGRFLDVGCGAGTILAAASHIGWQCWGFDVVRQAVQTSMNIAPNAALFLGQLDAVVGVEQFDLVNMSHVLEHLPQPREALRVVFELLKRPGTLRLEIPNVGSAEARLFGARWRGLDIPRHQVHFRPHSIARLLEEIGFSSIRIRPAMIASSISESALLLLPVAARRRVETTLLGRGLYLAAVFPASVSYALGNAAAIEVVAQRS